MESKYFIYDGVKSSDMGIYLIRTDEGMVESPYFGGVSMNEESIAGRLNPYHFKVTTEPIEFTIAISPLEKQWTPELRNRVGRWLFQNQFKPFQTSDDLGKIYYAMPISAPNFELYDARGFIEIDMMTNSPYAWSPVYYDTFDLSQNKGKTIITLENRSNVNFPFFPVIEVENKSGKTFTADKNGDKQYEHTVVLRNLSNGGKETRLEGFESKDEVVALDGENELIISSVYDAKPFKRFNREWLELVFGENQIEVEGQCILRTRMQFPILQ